MALPRYKFKIRNFLLTGFTFFIEVQVCLGYFRTILALLGYFWGQNHVQKHFGYLLMYTNNFPLDIIGVEMQN